MEAAANSTATHVDTTPFFGAFGQSYRPGVLRRWMYVPEDPRGRAFLHSTDTEEEESKFLADAERLALDISANQTFATVKPLLNIWAAFTPSNEVFSRD
jgi:hypothetical protein